MNIRNHLIEIQCNHRDVNDVAQALVHSIIFFRTHGKFNYKHEGSYSIGTLGFERAFCDHFDFTYIRCSSLSLISRINNKIQEFIERISENTHSGTLILEFYNRRPSRWPFNDSKILWEMWNVKISIAPTISSQQHLLQASPLYPLQPLSQIQHQQQQQLHSTTGLPVESQPQHHVNNRKSDPAVRIEDLLSQKILDIVRIVNSEKCSLPQMPTQPNLYTVFDTSHSDLQPYLYNILYKICDVAPSSHSVIGIGGGNTSGSGFDSASGSVNSASGLSPKLMESGGTVMDTTSQSTLKKFLLGTLEL